MAIVDEQHVIFESNDGRTRSRWHRAFAGTLNTYKILPKDDTRLVVNLGLFGGVLPRRILFGGPFGPNGWIEWHWQAATGAYKQIQLNIDDGDGFVTDEMWIRCDGQGPDYTACELFCCKD